MMAASSVCKVLEQRVKQVMISAGYHGQGRLWDPQTTINDIAAVMLPCPKRDLHTALNMQQ